MASIKAKLNKSNRQTNNNTIISYLKHDFNMPKLPTISRCLEGYTMDDDFIYIINEDKHNYPLLRLLKLLVEKFGHY